ncbi:hypothetical protein F5Y09DRAFT_341820 [Xylaria sp. FL1042]|nr:hypothetical protein F5Y09DRAFT_341820 [Xylaria sp. FL1042]
MKLILGLALFPLISLAWQNTIWYWREKVGGYLTNPYRQSRAPQFLLDARRPWIIENQSKIESFPDAETYLCSAFRQSLTNISGERSSGGGNGLDLPPNLFNHLEINNNRWEVNRSGWPNASLRAREMQRCPAALSQVKTFKTRIYIYDSKYSNMTSLETLKWDVPPRHARYFEERFVDRGLLVPSVTRLEPSSISHFLVQMYSNITILDRDSSMMLSNDVNDEDPDSLLIRATRFAPKLKRFGMRARWGWANPMIQELVSGYIPGVESLWGILQSLSSFQNLTGLELPDASTLGLGWDGGPSCGNAYYFGPGSREYEHQVQREGLEATERAGALVVKILPRLTSFSIGGKQAKITRYENGMLRASFPWAERIDQWVMDVLPDLPDELD